MADTVEEEELRDDEGLDEHDRAGGDDGQQSDDVEDADDIKDDVAWASQGVAGATRAFEERHCGGGC